MQIARTYNCTCVVLYTRRHTKRTHPLPSHTHAHHFEAGLLVAKGARVQRRSAFGPRRKSNTPRDAACKLTVLPGSSESSQQKLSFSLGVYAIRVELCRNRDHPSTNCASLKHSTPPSNQIEQTATLTIKITTLTRFWSHTHPQTCAGGREQSGLCGANRRAHLTSAGADCVAGRRNTVDGARSW